VVVVVEVKNVVTVKVIVVVVVVTPMVMVVILVTGVLCTHPQAKKKLFVKNISADTTYPALLQYFRQ